MSRELFVIEFLEVVRKHEFDISNIDSKLIATDQGIDLFLFK